MELNLKRLFRNVLNTLLIFSIFLGMTVFLTTVGIHAAKAVTLTPTWQPTQITPIGASNFTSISCIGTSNTCYAVGVTENETAVIYSTTNSGSNWSMLTNSNLVGKKVLLSSISCIAVTDCEVSGASSKNPNSSSPLAFFFNGATFADQTLPPNISTIGNVTCISANFCQATAATVSAGATMLLFDGNSWIQEVVPSQIQYINDVSCSSQSFCVAVGDSLTSQGGGSVAEAIYFDGNSWNTLIAPSSANVLDNVSCSGAFCAVFGSGTAQGSSQQTLLAFGFSGQSFQSLDLPSGFNGNISDLSCTSSTFCQAVGFANSGSGSVALGFSGSGWTLESLANSTSSYYSINCYSTNFCIAIGTSADAYINANWISLTLVPFNENLTDVSCPASNFCVAASNYYQGTNFISGIYVYNGSSWSTIPFISGDQIDSISCVSNSFCMAVASSNSNGNFTTVAVEFNGANWTQQATIGSMNLNDISCTSSSFCAAVGNNNGNATVSVFNGSAWTTQQLASSSSDLTSISCTANNFCQTVGYSTANSQVTSLDFSYDGTTWTQVTISGVSTQIFNSVSCVGTTFCTAVGQATAVFDGTSWTVTSLPSSISYIGQVSCVTSTFCQGLGFSTAQNSSQGVIVASIGTPCAKICPLNSAPWSIIYTSSDITLNYFSISCATVTFCVATGGTNATNVILTYEVVTPSISSVVLSSGPIAGGSEVTINGEGFANVSAVGFGSNASTSYTVVSSTQIVAVSPIGAGTVNVTVTANGMTSATSVNDQYTYVQTIYNPVNPSRICDTRAADPPYVNYNQCNLFGPNPLGTSSSLDVRITGVHRTVTIPSNATSVVLNVTATDTTQAGGFLTVYPTGVALPNTSSINFGAGQSVPNLVQVGIGNGGFISIYNFIGSTDVIVDVEGYFAPPSITSNAGGYVPISPVRVCDTRPTQPGVSSNQCNSSGSGTMGPNSVINVNVAGSGPGGVLDSVPSSAIAVVLNITATDTTQNGGFLTVYPAFTQTPNASNLNFGANESVANRVVVPIDPTSGDISIYNFNGNTDVIVDVNGYYTGATSSTSGSAFTPIVPFRLCDTRTANPPLVGSNECNSGATSNNGPLTQGETYTMQAATVSPIPSNAIAVVINVTSVNATTNGGFFTVFPTPNVVGGSPPNISDLNFNQGQVVANLDLVKTGSGGSVNVFNAIGSSELIVDVMGYYS